MIDTDNEGLAGLPESIDIDNAGDIEKIANLPLRAQQIGALISIGFTCADIDNAFALTEGTSRAYKSQYFAQKGLSISPKTRDTILACYLRAKAGQLVTGITPAKVHKAGVGELAKSAGLLLQRAQSLEGSNTVQDIGAKVSAALSKLAQVSNSKQLAANDSE